MSSQLFCKVLVFVSLYFYANGYMQNYPYPYAQQFNYNYQPPYQLYPQISNPDYGQQLYPYSIPQARYTPNSYPSIFPAQSGQIYPGSYSPVIPTQSGHNYPGGYPGQGGQIPLQGGVYPSPFPYIPQSYVSTQYGNIPVEIIDVNPNQGTRVVTTDNTMTLFNKINPNNETKTETSSGETSFTEEKKNIDFIRKPVTTSSIVQSSPQSTTITRTLDPKGGKINVIVQTSKPPLKKQDNSIEKEDENIEDNETTTKKYFSMFGR